MPDQANDLLLNPDGYPSAINEPTWLTSSPPTTLRMMDGNPTLSWMAVLLRSGSPMFAWYAK